METKNLQKILQYMQEGSLWIEEQEKSIGSAIVEYDENMLIRFKPGWEEKAPESAKFLISVKNGRREKFLKENQIKQSMGIEPDWVCKGEYELEDGEEAVDLEESW